MPVSHLLAVARVIARKMKNYSKGDRYRSRQLAGHINTRYLRYVGRNNPSRTYPIQHQAFYSFSLLLSLVVLHYCALAPILHSAMNGIARTV